ncbi:MAG: hypothetical protein WCG14_00145 [Chlamydiia bacterium]
MKKLIKSLIAVLLLIIASASIASFVFWSRTPDIISKNLTEKLGVKVEIEDMTLGMSDITMENFEINNIPKGLLKKAFTSQTISIVAPLTAYLNEKIVIEKIQLDNVYLGLEFTSPTSTQGNWTQIMSNLEKSMGSPKGNGKKPKKQKQSPMKPQGSPSNKSLLIKELIINDISIDLIYLSSNSKIKKLPKIKQIIIKNITSEEGFPLDQLTHSVLGQMLQEVFIKENLKNMIESFVPGSSQWNQLIEPFTDLFGS